MITNKEMIDPKDDRRHPPGPQALWNESYWFAFYDPRERIGVMTRMGLLVNKKQANVWFAISKDGKVVHDATNLDCPLPEGDIDNLSIGGVTYQCLEPLRTWRLLYNQGGTALDVTWRGFMPVFDYGHEQSFIPSLASNHLEQSGEVEGTVTIAGRSYPVKTVGHRDHSWGERDWTATRGWYWVEAQFGTELAFNSYRLFLRDGTEKTGGFVYDGKNMMGIQRAEISVETGDHFGAQKSATVRVLDEQGRLHQFVGCVLDVCPVNLGETNCDDAFAAFEMGGRSGYGIIELGYQHQKV